MLTVVATVAVVLGGLVVILSSRSPSYPAVSARADEAAVRVVSFNIAHGRGTVVDQRLLLDYRFRRNLLILGDFCRDLDADVIGMQEVDQESSWNGRFDHLAAIRAQAGYEHSAMGVNNVNSGLYALNYGNATLSRGAIVEQSTHPFGEAQLGEKGFLWTVVETSAGPLPVVNLHLDFRRASTRVQQVEQLIVFLETVYPEAGGAAWPLPVVLGDFNAEIDDPADAVARLQAFLLSRDPGYQRVPADTSTFPVYKPSERIDHVFVPSTWRVAAVTVHPARLSDHLPVIVDLLPAEPATTDVVPAE